MSKLEVSGRIPQRGDRERSDGPSGPHREASTSTETAVRIVDLYLEYGLSTYRIAELVQVDRQRVGKILRREGVTMSPRGAGRRKPLRRADVAPEATLRGLYLDRRLSSVDIGRLLGVSDRLVRSRLARSGIDRRSKGGLNRQDRTEVDPAEIDRLYREKEMAANAVGEQIGVSGPIVLREAHTYGIPVRAGGAPRPAATFDLHLIEALYDDRGVARALSANSVPVVREAGPIWERFPIPVPLTEELATALYCDCGLACFHIELLTGTPISTVLRRLDLLGIARRGRGGRSPFMQRWHAERRMRIE